MSSTHLKPTFVIAMYMYISICKPSIHPYPHLLRRGVSPDKTRARSCIYRVLIQLQLHIKNAIWTGNKSSICSFSAITKNLQVALTQS